MRRKLLQAFLGVGLLFASAGSVMADAIDNLQKDADGYYLLGSLDDWKVFAQAVNDGSTSLPARLTADISGVTENECLTTYDGHLDGQCHKLTVNINRTADDAAPIYVLKDGGIVENLWTDGVIATTNKYACGICAEQYASTIRNCVVTITFNSTLSGDGTYGGFAGKVWTGSVYENCVFAGTYNASDTYSVTGINGYNRGGVSTLTNCLTVSPNSIAGNNNSFYICREKAGATYSNCYYVANSFMQVGNSGATEVTMDQVKSGEVCFMLNGDQKEIKFYQNIGEDEIPLPFSTHKQVYTTADMRCDGKVLGDGTYTNDASASKRPDHNYVDGFCSVCGEAQEGYMSAGEDGYFNISTGAQYRWMVNYINNSENKAINMRLTADVEAGNVDMIDNYSGTFDGQGHSLTYNISADRDGAGMFVTFTGTLKNMELNGTVFNKQRYSGAVAGYVYGRIENVIGNVEVSTSYEGDATSGTIGGISYSPCTLKNVLAAGSFSSGTSHSNAGIIGWAGGTTTMQNVVWAGSCQTLETNSTTMIRNSGSCNFTNCYYQGTVANHEEGSRISQLPENALKSGAVCYVLNGSSFLNTTFYQTIGEDPLPTFDSTHGLVYKYGDEYADIHDEAGYDAFRTNFITAEENDCEEGAIAQVALIDQYKSQLEAMKSIATLQEFLKAYTEAASTKQEIATSRAAYVSYQAKVASSLALLNQDPENSTALRDAFRDYLEGDSEPCDDMPYGSASYIVEHHLLSTAELNAQITWMDGCWSQIVNSEYAPGTEITNLLTNADFSNGVNGWSTTDGYRIVGAWAYTPNVVESWNFNSDTQQTVNYLKNGIYEVTMNGYLRPGGRDDSHLYSSFLYANDQMVPLQYIQEDLLPADQAVSGQNCLIGNDVELNGCYYPGSAEGASYAFKANRFLNRILVNVTDGKLTLGVRAVGTGMSYDWTAFGCTKLYYRGDLSESDESLTNVLNGQVQRAQSILDTEIDFGENVSYFPNFSKTLRDQLTQYIQDAANASTPEAKYEMIQKFSPIYLQVLESQKAYTKMVQNIESANDAVSNYMAAYMTADQQAEFKTAFDNTWTSYIEGTASTEDAQNMSELKKLSFYDKIAGTEPAQENGYYQISNAKELLWFAQATTTNTSAKAVLTQDIDMSELIGWVPAGANGYRGEFDGQGHSIKNFKMQTSGSNTGFFCSLYGGATIKNFSLYGDLTCLPGTTNCGVVGYVNSSYVKFVHSHLNITCEEGTSGIAGVVGYGSADNRDCTFSLMSDCSYAGTMTINSTSGNFAGLCGGTEWMQFVNCANYGNINITNGGSGKVGGILAYADVSTFPGVKHCLNVGTITGTADYVGALVGWVNQYNLAESYWNLWMTGTAPAADTNNKATFMNTFEISADQAGNGYACERLNKNLSENHWYQVVGSDAYPMLYASDAALLAGNSGELGEPLITSASQLSSNASDRDEGQHIEYLIDGDASTFWHTDWHGVCTDQYHYLQVAMNKEFTGDITMKMTRRTSSSNDHPTEMIVWGSKDGVEYTQIATLNLPYDGTGTEVTAVFHAENVNYLRFGASNCTGDSYTYRTFWHAAEFQLYGTNANAIQDIAVDSQNIVKGIYNLNGQRLNKLQRGINIVDGKKILVK